MVLAQIGPVTTVLEAIATAVGAGVVLGSVSVGLYGLARGWPREAIGNRGLFDGYLGGAIGIGAVLVDLCIRYGGLK